MNEELVKNNFLIIKNFIPKERALSIADEFRRENITYSDNMVPGSPASYNLMPFLELLCEKTPEISKIVGETVLPTCSYGRLYKKGAILHKHDDRGPCEISLTINLDSDIDWPIFIEKPNKEAVGIILKSGDAAMYLGEKAMHWRDEFTGEYCDQIFLHYVRSRGRHGPVHYFDRDSYKKLCTANIT